MSRDGTQLAYSSAADSEGVYTNSAVVVARSDGGAARQVWAATSELGDNNSSDAAPSIPAWNPAGTELAVTEPTSNVPGAGPACEAWVIPVLGHGSAPVLGQDRRPVACATNSVAWSPDGKKLVYPGLDGPEVVNAAGGAPRLLARVRNPSGAPLAIASVSWSPDGTSILAAAFGGDGRAPNTLEVFPAGGGSPKVLVTPSTATATSATSSSTTPDQTPQSIGPPASNFTLTTPLYSPDGLTIAYAEEVYGESDVERVVVANADGSDARTIATSTVTEFAAVLTSWTAPPAPAP